MREFNELNITAAVVESFGKTPDARLQTILTSLVRHLHDFVRDVELSTEEWAAAVDYLTRTGHTCSDRRQEFILLSDTLGISMLVDAIDHRLPSGATQTTVLGPFYVKDPPELPRGGDVSRGAAGEALFVEGSVSAVGGGPLPGAVVDVWQSDSEGFYDVQRSDAGTRLRARLRTDAAGHFHFWSIMPTSYPIPEDGPVGQMLRATGRHPYRPAHVHFMISAEGHDMLVTHIFAKGDPYLDSDVVFAVKESLVREFTHEGPGTAPDGTRRDRPWRKLSYDFVLKPAARKPAV